MYPRARARLWSEGAVCSPGLGLGWLWSEGTVYSPGLGWLWSEGAVCSPGLGLGYGLKVLCVAQD